MIIAHYCALNIYSCNEPKLQDNVRIVILFNKCIILEQNKQCYLLSIGANTADKERLCSVQCLQQFGQRSLKQIMTGVY